MRALAVLLALLTLEACQSSADDQTARVGADADAHGCRPSAGYRWCARTAQCERPWELAEAEAFEASEAAFTQFCAQDRSRITY
ncbi:peptidase [Geminicoccus harenae]|uniref:peptidase n=1 Tax=Geminicoccus harenae TaxID=2498453 RepID=UPI00168B09E5|nr:peptidase [Geminicoccus harenae]